MDLDTSEHKGVAPAEASGAGYRVLARKYRPSSFADLIGQEAMVRTLRNAFASNRIAQAYMLTGVRGVGKTTTARILARALNYSGVAGVEGPTLDMAELGEHCAPIMESRHPDVLEMDAASHTGIGDIREIIDSVRYRPIAARYKVYIIDEVHMLSTAAFNGLLKTLEEPPEHVKFVFATTEIRKVPITVLSRCQRFDLRRVEAERLVEHLKVVCAQEAVPADGEALALIARAAEGSVRDALSLLDQAIAHGFGRVEGEATREMLGLADRARVLDLFEQVMRGQAAEALAELKAQHDLGADPLVVLTDLADVVHFVTRLKAAPAAARDTGLSEAERSRGVAFAEGLGLRALNRAWQILLKGMTEVQVSPRPLAAAEMVLIRLCFAADLPTPDDALKALGRASPGAPAPRDQPVEPLEETPSDPDLAALIAPERPPSRAAPAEPSLSSFADVVALAGARRDLAFKHALETGVRPVRFAPPEIAISLVEGASGSLGTDLARRLETWTGKRWQVIVEQTGGTATFREEREAEEARLMEEVRRDPTVASVLNRFPGTEILEVRTGAPPSLDAADLLDPEPVETD